MKLVDSTSIYDYTNGNFQHLTEKQQIQLLDEVMELNLKMPEFDSFLKKAVLDAELEWDATANKDAASQIWLEMQTNKPNEIKQEMTLFEVAAVLGKIYGYRIDPKTTTVSEWYAHIKMAKHGN